MTTTETSQFSYGTFTVTSSVRDLYKKAPLSQTYPLPDVLPMHHPALQRLEGIYPVVDSLPPWWSIFASHCDPILRPLLQGVTIQEWRAGVISQQRWRTWKNSMSPQEKDEFQTTSVGKMLMSSPKLMNVLTSNVEKDWFEERGPKDTQEELDLIISFRPEYLLNMSNGNGWTNCLHLYEGWDNEHLPANWYDTGVAVAMVVPRGADIWQGAENEREGVVLARTTLRVFTDEQAVVLVICRTYDNNKTVLALLLSRLVSLFQDLGLSWGTIPYYSLTHLFQSGFIGGYWPEEEQELNSVAFWSPFDFQIPYIDGIFDWGSTANDDLTFITAKIHRWSPYD